MLQNIEGFKSLSCNAAALVRRSQALNKAERREKKKGDDNIARPNKSGLNKSQYDRVYQKKYTKNIGIQFNKIYDAELLDRLDQEKNKSAYIKALIKKDIDE